MLKVHIEIGMREIEMFELINQNNTLITLGFSAIVTLSTVIYAVLTWKLVHETQKMRKIQSEPRVSVYLQRNETAMGFIDIVIQNVGQGPAYSIELKVEPNFICRQNVSLSELDVFKHVIPYLAPNQRVQFF